MWSPTWPWDSLPTRFRFRYQRDTSWRPPRCVLLQLRCGKLKRIAYVFQKDGTREPRYQVLFAYEERPDQISDAKPGFELRLSQRLVSIRVFVRGVQLRRYQLSYRPTTDRTFLSRLERVQQYGVEDVDPYPIDFRFEYTGESSVPCSGSGCDSPQTVIPRLDNQGAAVSQSDRIASFRAKLTDVALLDESGYLTVPFATSLARLSPLTRDHKIKRIEVEIIGSDVGDSVGRVYLRQAGTGSVRSVSGDSIYYRFPELTAVLDPFFNGVRALGAEIYASDRLRDRPYVNSRWDLVINQKDELVNKDIDLNSITDIRIYFYYTDFTAQ